MMDPQCFHRAIVKSHFVDATPVGGAPHNSSAIAGGKNLVLVPGYTRDTDRVQGALAEPNFDLSFQRICSPPEDVKRVIVCPGDH